MPVYGRNGVEASDQMGVIRSSDNGASWGSLVQVTGASANMNEATLIQVGGGNVRAYIREETDPAPIHTALSTDSGATWGAVSALSWNVRPKRPAAIRSQLSGTIFLMYMQTGTSFPAYRYSIDNGASWSSEVAYSVTGFYEYMGGIARPSTDQIAAFVSMENTTNPADAYMFFFTWVVS